MTTSTVSSSREEWPHWVNADPRLTGRQEAADESWFPGDESLGDQAAQLAARVGVKPFYWQWIALRKILSRRPDGTWCHPDVLALTTRQCGKSELIIHRLIFGLFVLGETQVLSCQRWVTAESIYKRLKAIIESRPSLYRRLAKDPSSSSSRAVIELKSGASLAIGVRSGDLGRGYSAVDLCVFDESYDLTEAEVAALTGAQLSSPNAQTIYASTPAVWEKHSNCQVLSDLRRLGQKRQSDLYFSEWAAPADAPRDSPETWRLASPSYGVIQKERDVRRMLLRPQLRRPARYGTQTFWAGAIGRQMIPKSAPLSAQKSGHQWSTRRPSSSARSRSRWTARKTERLGRLQRLKEPPKDAFIWKLVPTNTFRRMLKRSRS